ncbi:MAG: peptide-methionine (S)-S-oxide reductase MsrA [Cyanobium sp.]
MGRLLLAALLALLTLLPAAPVLAEEAVLAGGCFWCLEHDLEHLPGVAEVVSGYSGGSLRNPTYRQVSAGGTGHQEAVRVRFDPERISYAALLRSYWRNVDPLDGAGQFCDRGSSYRPVIFARGEGQLKQARASLEAAARELDRPASAIRVQIRPLKTFWPAEDYHQNYAERNDLKYRYYRWACGRDRRLEAVWRNRARRGLPWAG